MKQTQFEHLMAQLKDKPIPGKRVFVWINDKNTLCELIPHEMFTELALSHLSLTAQDLSSENSAKKALRRSLKKELALRRSAATGQQVLVVLDAHLLARYNVGLGPFFDYYVGDKTAVVLVAPSPRIAGAEELCDYFEVNENTVLSYLKRILEQNDSILDETRIIARNNKEESRWLNLD